MACFRSARDFSRAPPPRPVAARSPVNDNISKTLTVILDRSSPESGIPSRTAASIMEDEA